jgi:hypothetical protein
MLMYFFAGFFLESHTVYDQTQGTGAVFSWLDFTDISNVLALIIPFAQ